MKIHLLGFPFISAAMIVTLFSGISFAGENVRRRHQEGLPPALGNIEDSAHVTRLSMKVVYLPSDVRRLTKLKTLQLGTNKRIPNAVEMSDEELRARGIVNPADWREFFRAAAYNTSAYPGLYELCPEIGNLKQLEFLQTTYSQLHEVPAEIGQCTNLSWLRLCHGCLRTLPPQIGQL